MDHLQNVMGYFDQQQPLCAEHDRISKDLYKEFGVKAGLRDENGKGVLAGLTNISDIRAFQYVDGVKKPADGQLLYRGYDVKDLIRGSSGSRFAFEEAGYLLLFGELPTQEKLEEFCRVLGECRTMPTNFTRDVIMKAPSHDIMNSMARSVLTLASYDPKAGDLEISNVLRQSIQLAGIFPMLAVYSYHAYNHYEKDGSMYIHRPDPELSTSENFLRMLRPDMKYTELEARVLDVALLLHGEHGGGVGGQHLGHFGHGHFMVVGFRHHAALAVMRHGHGTLNGEDKLALELFGDAHHVLIRALAFSGHDGGMEFKADDFEQHVGYARVRAVQQRDRTARAPLPLNPENGRTFAGERLGKGLVDGGVKHLGNPEPGHRARTQFDEISSGKSHSCLLDKGMLIRWIARDAAQRAL